MRTTEQGEDSSLEGDSVAVCSRSRNWQALASRKTGRQAQRPPARDNREPLMITAASRTKRTFRLRTVFCWQISSPALVVQIAVSSLSWSVHGLLAGNERHGFDQVPIAHGFCLNDVRCGVAGLK